jgi:hypothetical protein
VRMFPSEQSTIVCVACAACNLRKILIHQRHPVGNDASPGADIQLGADMCVLSGLGNDLGNE